MLHFLLGLCISAIYNIKDHWALLRSWKWRVSKYWLCLVCQSVRPSICLWARLLKNALTYWPLIWHVGHYGQGQEPYWFSAPWVEPQGQRSKLIFLTLGKCAFEQRNRKLSSSRFRFVCHFRSTWSREVINRDKRRQHQTWRMWHIIRKNFSSSLTMTIVIIFTCDIVSATSLWALFQRVFFRCIVFRLFHLEALLIIVFYVSTDMHNTQKSLLAWKRYTYVKTLTKIKPRQSIGIIETTATW